MENLKHTPAPWFQSHRQIPNDENGDYSTQVYTRDGKTICTLSWYPMPAKKQIIDGKPVIVTETYRDANAKLIAAAPDLLEVALQIKNEIDTEGLLQGSYDKLLKAIDKATK